MKRKILILPSWYPSPYSPLAGNFVEEQVKALSNEYEVRVLFPDVIGSMQIPSRLKKPSSMFFKMFRSDGINIYHYPHLWIGPLKKINYWYSYLVTKHGFSKMISEGFTPDIIHAHVVLPAGWLAARLSREYNIPAILTEHTSSFKMYFDKKFQKPLIEDALRTMKCIIAVSPSMRTQIIDLYPEYTQKTITIGNIIRTSELIPTQIRKKSPVMNFLSIGYLIPRKGFRFLIEAAAILISRGIEEFSITIGGEGVSRNALEELISNLKIEEYVKLAGLLDRAQVKQHLESCDVFVLPSLLETFGVVLGEAMSYGKPVISTFCGGAEYVVTEQSGVLVEPGNALALADEMEKFIKQERTYDPQTIRASIEERFGEKAFLRNVQNIYSSIIKS